MKICIHCKEQMQADARVCPHCQRTQTRLDVRDPRTGLVLVVLVLAVIFGIQHYFEKEFKAHTGSSSPIARGAVVVLEPSFAFVPGTSSSCDMQELVIIGRLRNTSSHGVKDPKIIVSFYNSSHRLVDVVSESNLQTTIGAGGEVGFRATSKPTAMATEYVTFDIKVVGGSDLE